jgi:polar amino acid transport system substrate-binding protein
MPSTVPPDAIADLAPDGRLVAAINFGNVVLAQRDPATGEPRGISADLARELARRLDVPLAFATYDGAGQAFAEAGTGAWRVAFLANEPARAEGVTFTAPYVLIEGTYLVRADSPLRTPDDVDREGVRIAAGQGSAYDLYLSRTLKRASLVHAPTSSAAMEKFLRDSLEAAGGVRQALARFAEAHRGLKVMEGRFMAIEQAMCVPKGRDAGARYLRSFVEEMKASGFVAEGLRRSGQGDATVAAPSPV